MTWITLRKLAQDDCLSKKKTITLFLVVKLGHISQLPLAIDPLKLLLVHTPEGHLLQNLINLRRLKLPSVHVPKCSKLHATVMDFPNLVVIGQWG